MRKLLVQKLHPDAKKPEVVHPGQDLGFDIHAVEDVFVEQGKQAIVPTGIAAVYVSDLEFRGYHGYHIPAYGLEIGDRSGLAAKFGFHTLAGKIDAGYRGEIKVIVMQLGLPVHLHPEDRQKLLNNPFNLPGMWTEEKLEGLSPTELRKMAARIPLRLGYQIQKGDKIAQMLPREVNTTDNIEFVDELPAGARGAAGFGSSGNQ